MDARIHAEILEAVDTRVNQLMRARPYTAYGVVSAVDSVNRKASVLLSGDPSASAGFKYGKVTPVVGALVRVVIDPRGDRYIDEVGGEGYFRTERPVGGTYLLGSVTGDASDRARARIATDGSGLPTLYLGNGVEAIGSETVKVGRNASGELDLTTASTGVMRINGQAARLIMVDTSGSGTFFVPNTSLGQAGGCLLTSFGNDGVGVMGWYRAGSFNYVSGLWSGPGSVGFQGSTFSPGAHTWSWYIESNVTGARLAIRSQAGFQRTFGLWVLG